MYMLRPITALAFLLPLFLSCAENENYPWLCILIGLVYLMLCLLLNTPKHAVRYALWHIGFYILWCIGGVYVVKIIASFLYEWLMDFFMEPSIIDY